MEENKAIVSRFLEALDQQIFDALEDPGNSRARWEGDTLIVDTVNSVRRR
jgi:hypothetical protein